MDTRTAGPRALPAAVFAVAGVVVVVLLLFAARYGYHRDEMYFVVAGSHPAFGYVDQPPLTPLLARGLYLLGGGSLVVMRLLPALLGGAVVLLVGLLAKEFGGTRRSQVLAAGAAACTPLVWNLGHLFSTATLDAVVWLVVLYAVIRRLRGGTTRWWLVAGFAAGIGLQNKHTVVILVLGLLIGLLVADRGRFREPLLWVGLVTAAVIALPNVLWQATHGWPQLEMAGSLRDEHGGIAGGVLAIVLLTVTLNPALLGRAAAGWSWLWRDDDASGRVLAIAAPVALVVQLLSGGQFYYVAPFGLALTAAGFVSGQELVTVENGRTESQGRRLLVPALVMVALAPTVLPVLPPGVADRIGLVEVNPTLGDQVGWPGFVQTVQAARARVDRTTAAPLVVLTANYGEAAALQLAGLPHVHSGHNSYWAWGPPDETTSDTVLAVGYLPAWVEDWCPDPTVIDTVVMPVANEEHGRPLLRCTRATSWAELWPARRHFN